MAADDTIFTAVSRPGPAERSILERLAPAVRIRPRIGAGVAIRSLETTTSPADRPSFLFLHGRGHAATVWERWLTRLGSSRRAVALDLPGFGHSGAAPLLSRNPEAGLSWFTDPIESIAVEEGPIVVVGHSLGGLIALELALRGRARVQALVLVGAMGLGPAISPSARLYLRFGPERLARMKALLPSSPEPADEVSALRKELYLVRGGRPLAKEAFDLLVPLTGAVLHRGERLAEVKVPTLLLWGDDDEAFPLPAAMQAAARLPRGRLEVLPAKHSPHLELVDRSIDLVEGFLSDAGI